MKKNRQRTKLNKIIALVTTAVLGVSALSPVYAAKTATETKIDEQNEKIEDLKEQQEAAEEAVEQLQQIKDGMENQLSGLNEDLSELSDSIEELSTQILRKEEEIDAKQAQIDEASAELEQSVAKQDQQYEDMKKRIRFMYEYSQGSVYMSLLSTGFSNFISKSEYIKDLTAYDRKMLEEYKAVTAEVIGKKMALEKEQAELVAAKKELTGLEDETKKQKEEVTASIQETREDIAESLEDIEDAQAIADAIDQQLQEAIAYEAELEKKKAAEDAARIAAIKAAEEANKNRQAVVVSDSSDAELLAALIYCEAGGEPYEGQLAVGSVVMNRVRSGSFPNTVSGVIYQSGQFTPAASGRLATVLANNLTTNSCRSAANSVLAGNIPYPNYLYFRSARVSLPGVAVTWIGNQQFY